MVLLYLESINSLFLVDWEIDQLGVVVLVAEFVEVFLGFVHIEAQAGDVFHNSLYIRSSSLIGSGASSPKITALICHNTHAMASPTMGKNGFDSIAIIPSAATSTHRNSMAR